ncbi:MAG: M48 family metalloprotease [Candidatus Rokuibacteriota bacterium]
MTARLDYREGLGIDPAPVGLSRRRFGGGLAATLAVLSGGCATISPSEERRLGQEGAEEVERTVGLVDDPKLVGYVRQVAGRLAQAAKRTDVSWQCNVTDDTEPNAFALPGGYVYVTRGLLALLNSEDELAGALGHEMAHVLDRHAARRAGAATPFALLFGIPAGILGAVSPALGGVVGGTGELASGMVLASYSREQERDADRHGIALAARAGWDPAALASFLHTLEREEALAGHNPNRPGFFATHPATPERVGNVRAAARAQTRAPATPIAGSRGAFLGKLEGLVVGDNPASGVFLGSLFAHPGFDIALEMPAKWKTINTAEAAGAVAPDGDAAVVLSVSGAGEDPAAAARADGLSEAQLKQLRSVRISSLPAALLVADTRNAQRAVLTWIAYRQRVFRVTALTRIRDWSRYGKILDRTAGTFRPLLPADRARLVESRLRVRLAGTGETIAGVLARGGGTWNPAQMAVANGTTVDAKLQPGWPVKVPVSQRYNAGV